jgi:hypothetical protein
VPQLAVVGLRVRPPPFNLRRIVSLPRVLVAALVALALAVGASDAHAERLTAGESSRLARGETVIREQTWEQGDRRYVGGLTYTVLQASAAEITSILDDVDAYRRVLPRTKRARLVGVEGGDRLIELAQGNALMEAEYTIRVRRASAGEVRFWLEPSLPHGIDDAWGFFRLAPFVSRKGEPRVLLTYGVLVDIGPGLVRELFEERLRAALLSVPQLVRRYVAEAMRPR